MSRTLARLRGRARVREGASESRSNGLRGVFGIHTNKERPRALTGLPLSSPARLRRWIARRQHGARPFAVVAERKPCSGRVETVGEPDQDTQQAPGRALDAYDEAAATR